MKTGIPLWDCTSFYFTTYSVQVIVKVEFGRIGLTSCRIITGCIILYLSEWGCPKSRIAPFAIVYFGKKYYLTVAKTKHYSNG